MSLKLFNESFRIERKPRSRNEKHSAIRYRSDPRLPPINSLSFTTQMDVLSHFCFDSSPELNMVDRTRDFWRSIVSQLEIYDCRGGNRDWFTGYEIGVVLPLLNSL